MGKDNKPLIMGQLAMSINDPYKRSFAGIVRDIEILPSKRNTIPIYFPKPQVKK